MHNLDMKILVGPLEESRFLLPPLQMSHHEHHWSLTVTSQQQKPQRLEQRLVEMVVVYDVGSQHDVKLPTNALHLLHVTPRQRRHVDLPATWRQGPRIGFDVEPQVREHVREVGDRDASPEQRRCRDPHQPRAGPQLQHAEAAALGGDQAGEGPGAVEEGDQGGGGGPQLEGEPLGGELPDHYGGVYRMQMVRLRRRLLFLTLTMLHGLRDRVLGAAASGFLTRDEINYREISMNCNLHYYYY